jgi:hypothetical protein
MNRPCASRIVAAAALSACVVAPYPYGYPTTTVSSPPSFDRSWDARARRGGRRRGAGHERGPRQRPHHAAPRPARRFSIELRPQADKTLQVIFTAPDSKESNPTLNDRWLQAYQARMGR